MIGSASSGPHCFRIKAGKPSGPVADVTSSCLRIFKTSRSRMRRNLSRVCRGGLGSENSLAPSPGNCDFAENVEANRQAFEAGSVAHVSLISKGEYYQSPYSLQEALSKFSTSLWKTNSLACRGSSSEIRLEQHGIQPCIGRVQPAS